MEEKRKPNKCAVCGCSDSFKETEEGYVCTVCDSEHIVMDGLGDTDGQEDKSELTSD